jgi:hypothetical protein
MEKSNPTPISKIEDEESKNLFIIFCSLVSILNNKKINLANIFLLLLKEKKVLELYMRVCEFDTEFEGLKYFLEYDNSIHKSKYIKKYLNSSCFSTEDRKA